MLEMLDKQIDQQLDALLERDYGPGVFAAFASQRLSAEYEPRDFRGMTFEEADVYAKDQAERAAEGHVQDSLDENLPGDEEDDIDQSEWNWEAMAKMANTRWGLSLRDRDLKKLGRDNVGEFLIEEARKSIAKADLSEGKIFLEEDFPQRAILGWVHHKFGLDLPLEEVKKRDAAALKVYIKEQVRAAYDQREAEYPVMAGIYRYTIGQGPQARLDREALVAWARERFEADLDVDNLKNKQRDDIRAVLIEHSREAQHKAETAVAEMRERLDKLFGAAEAGRTARAVAGPNGQLDSLAAWIEQSLRTTISGEEIGELDRDALEQKLLAAIDDRYRPEMRRMERMLLLQIVDSTWKDHLLVMDRLRSSVGLVGYAQVDPKVEYKREGMKLFEQMWSSIGDHATSLVFRMEQLNEEFVGSTWVETAATHAEAPGATEEFQRSQQQTNSAADPDAKPEPIRHRGARVGRNDPCPCGSGKKYKNCCMRKGSGGFIA
jgi:preprotein translocase subunit SecA